MQSEHKALRNEVSTLTTLVDRLLKSHEEKDREIREMKGLIEKLTSRRGTETFGYLHGDFVEADSSAVRTARPAEHRVSDNLEFRLRHMSDGLLAVQGLVTEHSSQLDDIRLRQDIMDVKTTNGVFVWKIPDVLRRYREAVERRTISLYSPPFYTSPHGYKLCIRIYLNGDGIGKSTHISLFFFLMRSEHDNLLSWPFKQAIRFTLLHQKKPSLNISEAFLPDSTSVSYKKPTSDMNVASGFPKFARQSVLEDEGFTQDNMIFVKCQVDLSGLSPL